MHSFGKYDVIFATCVAGCLWPGFVYGTEVSCTILGSTTPGEREEGKRKEVKGRKRSRRKREGEEGKRK